jgi:hypothetical protein
VGRRRLTTTPPARRFPLRCVVFDRAFVPDPGTSTRSWPGQLETHEVLLSTDHNDLVADP